MSSLQRVYDLTKEMLEKFASEHQNREELINAFEAFVEERDVLLKEVKGPYSDQEKTLGQELVTLDSQLKVAVDQYFTNFKDEIISLNKKRQSNKKYTNPYANVLNRGGSFIDKKN